MRAVTNVIQHTALGETLSDRFDLTRFSKLKILIHATALILNLYKRYNKNTSHKSITVTADDIIEAETFWVKEAQRELHESVTSGKLTRLAPQYKNGLIVVGGRAKCKVAATWNQEEFILLPYRHRFSLLIARYMHQKTGHLAESATTAMIRSKYWIINLPRLAKKVVFSCVLCKVKREMLCGQVMADLPIERLSPTPVFYCTGIDFSAHSSSKVRSTKEVVVSVTVLYLSVSAPEQYTLICLLTIPQTHFSKHYDASPVSADGRRNSRATTARNLLQHLKN